MVKSTKEKVKDEKLTYSETSKQNREMCKPKNTKS
jgi:hypothetical protein